jgi:cephalosporin hydroxylase
MDTKSISNVLSNIKYMSLEVALFFDNLITKHSTKEVLEIGTHKGAGTCYIANSLIKNEGHVTTIDINKDEASVANNRLARELSQSLKLFNIKYIFSQYGSAWEMLKLLEQGNKYDMIYIDGSHEFECMLNDFYLADKLLKLHGFIIFDDYNLCWDFVNCKEKWYKLFCEKQGKEKIAAYQTQKVINLIRKYHKNYEIDIQDNQAICCRRIKYL